MGWENNGTARSLKITVDSTVGGNQVSPERIYNGQLDGSSWGNPSYSALTDEEMQRLSEADFTTRYDDFVAYVESVESGLDFTTDIDGDGAIKYDPATCLATTTTTVFVPPPVYAFSIKYGKYPVDVCSGTDSIVYSSVQVPIAGTVLYKDLALTQTWDTVNGEHVLFVSPVIHGQLAVEVSLVTGAIVQITTFDCGGVAPATTTTTAAPVVEIDIFNESENENTLVESVQINASNIPGASFPVLDGDSDLDGYTELTGFQNFLVEITTTTGTGSIKISGTNQSPGTGVCEDISDYGPGTHDVSFGASILCDPDGTYNVTITVSDESC